MQKAQIEFFQTHDPTTPKRQGHDIGLSYHFAIYFTSEAQRLDAIKTINDVNTAPVWGAK